jgi:hypothetical protein
VRPTLSLGGLEQPFNFGLRQIGQGF